MTGTPEVAVTDPRSSTVDDVVRRSAGRTPDRLALVFEDRSWTYAELDAAVSRAAGHLLSLGLSTGDRVATVGANSDAYLLAFLGCARAGLVHVPVNHALTGGELSYLLAQSGSRVALVDPGLRDGVEAVRADTALEQVLVLHGGEDTVLPAWSAGVVPEIEMGTADTDLVQLLYTSGTTSKPKGAMMTHRALVHEYVSTVHALDLGADDDPLHCMPLYHSAGMHVFVLPYLAVGATNRLLARPDVPEILRLIETERLGALFLAADGLGATVQFGRLRDPGPGLAAQGLLRRLDHAGPGAGAAADQAARSWRSTTASGSRRSRRWRPCCDRRSTPSGRSRAGGRCCSSRSGWWTPRAPTSRPDVPGELLYRSPQLCVGYWDDAATAEAFRDGWFHSGDLVRRDAGGYVTVVDRIKDVINTGGVLVASREVEDALYTHPAVAEVAVVATPDERWIEAVTAVVVLRRDQKADEAELIAHARTTLAPFKVPKRVHFVAELPRNQSGKLLKRVLRDQL